MAARRSSKKKTGSKAGNGSTRALAKRSTGALGTVGDVAGWRERAAKYVTRDKATAGAVGGWPYIGTRNGIFRVGEDDSREVLENVIILGAMHENAMYEGDYDPNNTSAPVCFALAEEEDHLAPPEILGDARQCLQTEPTSESCVGCWANQFGTAERGKGKACKNLRRLALLPGDKLEVPFLSKVDGAMLRVSVTSVKKYSSYVNKVTQVLGVPLFFLRTNITIESDEKNQFVIDFEPADWIEVDGNEVPAIIQNDPILEVLEGRVKEAEDFLKQLPSMGGDEESGPKRKGVPARAGGRATPSRKKAGTRSSGGRKKTASRASKDAPEDKPKRSAAGGSKRKF